MSITRYAAKRIRDQYANKSNASKTGTSADLDDPSVSGNTTEVSKDGGLTWTKHDIRMPTMVAFAITCGWEVTCLGPAVYQIRDDIYRMVDRDKEEE